jgi:hypothetical protein
MVSFELVVTPLTWPGVRAGLSVFYVVAALGFAFIFNQAEWSLPARLGATLLSAGYCIRLYLFTVNRLSLTPRGLELELPFTRRMYRVCDIRDIQVRPFWSHSASTLIVCIHGSRWRRRFHLQTSVAQRERLLRELPAVVDAYVATGLIARPGSEGAPGTEARRS